MDVKKIATVILPLFVLWHGVPIACVWPLAAMMVLYKSGLWAKIPYTALTFNVTVTVCGLF